MSDWLTVPEAADYCRCSARAFLNMHLAANDAGGRKVYDKQDLDAAIRAAPPNCPLQARMALMA